MLALGFLLLAVALGVKHSLDADHLAAVSRYYAAPGAQPARLGAWWAFGHSITASLLALAFWWFREVFRPVGDALQWAAPVVLVGAGAWGVWCFVRPPREARAPPARTLAGIGALHGLASNDELLLVLVASLTVTSPFEAVGGVLAFSLGVAVGMAGYAVATRWLAAKLDARAPRFVPLVASVASLSLGAWLIAGLWAT